MNPLYDLEAIADTLEEAGETKQMARTVRDSVEAVRFKLEQMADVMAVLGRIHNTPCAKREWIEQA